jgi:hypothetical protein
MILAMLVFMLGSVLAFVEVVYQMRHVDRLTKSESFFAREHHC